MERACKVPMYFDNDANMGARGESQYGAARNVDNMAYVKVATGIGCGLIVNGDIYRGSSGAAGELGHVTIDDNGPVCDCGNRGCLEVVAGAAAVTFAATRGVYPDSSGTSGGHNGHGTVDSVAAGRGALARLMWPTCTGGAGGRHGCPGGHRARGIPYWHRACRIGEHLQPVADLAGWQHGAGGRVFAGADPTGPLPAAVSPRHRPPPESRWRSLAITPSRSARWPR